MPLTAEVAAHQVQERLKAIQGLIHSIDNERRRNESNLNNLNHLKEKYHAAGERSSSTQHKLKSQYKTCLNDATQEETIIRNALAKIAEIRNIRNERRIQVRNAGNKETIRRGVLMNMVKITAKTLPLYVGKPGEKTPPLCGAVPADSRYIAKPGDIVAALVKGLEDGDGWILAEIVTFNPTQNKYEVDDIDETKNRHVLSKRRIVPLPLMRANPETNPDALFAKGTMVMALYPRTTTFYKAIIINLPPVATADYELIFEDTSYPEGYSPPMMVAQRYVIAYKQTKKITNVAS